MRRLSQPLPLPSPSLARPSALIALLLASFAIGCSEVATMPPSEVDEVSPANGAVVFSENCAVCHTLPILSSLFQQNRGRAPGFVYDAITEGNMRRMGSHLDVTSRRAVAEFFTGVDFDTPAARRDFEVSPKCAGEHSRFDWADRSHPSWGGSLRNLRSPTDSLSLEEASHLEVAWVIAFPEASQLRSQPTAAGGALFVGSHNGSVYALDQATGCTRWHFKAVTEVRSAITIDLPDELGAAASPGSAPPIIRAFFADRAANVYALNAESGELLWRQSADPHMNAAVTGSVTAYNGRVFVPISSNDDINSLDPTFACCTHAGAVVALDAETGEPVWRTPTIEETAAQSAVTDIGTGVWGPSGASVWNTPTISQKHGLLYVGSGNNHSQPATSMSDSIIAMDLTTGRVVWKYQAIQGDIWNAACIFGNPVSCPTPVGPDTDFGATTMLVEDGERSLLVAGAKSGYLHALDAKTGDLVWKTRVARGGPEAGIRYGMATRDGLLYVPSTDQGEQEVAGMTARPGLFAIRAKDGSLLWRATTKSICGDHADCDGAIAAPPIASEEAVITAGMNGVVHIFDRASGKRIWHFDTAREFETLRGGKTRGGGISGTAGPLMANGRLFVSSGYGQAQRPGNALIAFTPR